MLLPLPILKKCKIEVPEETPIFIPRTAGFYHLPYSLSLLPVPSVFVGLQFMHCKGPGEPASPTLPAGAGVSKVSDSPSAARCCGWEVTSLASILPH